SALPVARKPFAAWKAATAFRVLDPALPSISPVEKPARSNDTCSPVASGLAAACGFLAGVLAFASLAKAPTAPEAISAKQQTAAKVRLLDFI
ncbi:MAG: hypothetical protein ABIV06_06410, partial [Thermoanaerobaculia bacterium]